MNGNHQSSDYALFIADEAFKKGLNDVFVAARVRGETPQLPCNFVSDFLGVPSVEVKTRAQLARWIDALPYAAKGSNGFIFTFAHPFGVIASFCKADYVSNVAT